MENLPVDLLVSDLALGRVVLRSALRFAEGWRVGVFARAAEGLAVPPLRLGWASALPEHPAVGGWDAGFAGGFSHGWWGDGAGWTCVGGDGSPVLLAAGGAVRCAAGALAQVRAVRLEVAPGWELRALQAEGPDGALRLLSVEDLGPRLDPSYDHDLLSADLGWLEQLALSLAAALDADFFEQVGPRSPR